MSGYVILQSVLDEIAAHFIAGENNGNLDYSKYTKAIELVARSGKPVVAVYNLNDYKVTLHFSLLETSFATSLVSVVPEFNGTGLFVITLYKGNKTIEWHVLP